MKYNATGTNGCKYEVEIPNTILFAYNHNTIGIKCTYTTQSQRPSYIEIVINNKTIKAYNYNNTFNVCIDSLLRAYVGTLNFPNVTSGNTTILIVDDTGDEIIYDNQSTELSISVIYGYLLLGQRMSNIGTYSEKDKAFIRNITWFSNYKTKFSMLAFAGQTFEGRENGSEEETYDYSVNEIDHFVIDYAKEGNKGKISSKQYAVLDNSQSQNPYSSVFSSHFAAISPNSTYVNAHICDRTKGLFVRWVDNRGLWYSYLFDEGDHKNETEHSSNRIGSFSVFNNVPYDNSFPISHSLTRKWTGCAVNIDAEKFEDISTIANALYVEMYIEGVFKRVNILSTSVSKNAKKTLADIEVEFEIDKTEISL